MFWLSPKTYGLCPELELKLLKNIKIFFKIIAKYINRKVSESKLFHVNNNRFMLIWPSNEEYD